MKKLKGFEIRSMMRRAANSDGFELDVVGIEAGINRRDNEGDNSYASRVLADLKDMYRALHAAEAAPQILEESLPAPAAQHYEDIKDRLDKLGEKVDQASSSLKDIIQAQFRPVATGANLDELITARGAREPATERGRHIHNLLHKRFPRTTGSVCDEIEGTSNIDYFREQFMNAPFFFDKSDHQNVTDFIQMRVNAATFSDEHVKAEGERIHGEVVSMAKKLAAEQTRRKALASVGTQFIDMLFNGVESDDLMKQIEIDFGPGAMSIYHPSSEMILRSVRNLLVISVDKIKSGDSDER